MKKFLSFFVMLMLLSIFTSSLMAQPPYYNYNTNGTNNSFPLGIAGGKNAQWLILANTLINPTPAPAGNITVFWFRVGDTYPLNATFTTFELKMAQANITALPTGSYHAPMTTVFARASYPIVAAGGTWVQITLDTPFPYNPTLALIVEMGQCGGTGITGFPMCTTTLTGNMRNWSVGGCPHVYSGVSTSTLNCGVTIAPPLAPPELIYYKFENNPTLTSVKNCASSPVGTSPAPIASNTLTGGGQFDTCMTATGAASGGITTGWNCNLAASSWTISMWITIPTDPSGSAYYLFGDPGSTSFRCFHNGVALPDNLVLRGPFTDVTVTGIGPNPTCVTFVYDATIPSIKAYKNGVLAVTVPQTAFTLPAGTGFKVGGYSTSTSYIGKMDEFRLYNRPLSAADVLASYNQDISCHSSGVGINDYSNNIELLQNYPNPFNNTTIIAYNLTKNTNVVLKVYDLMGKEVALLVNKTQTAGKYEVDFDATKLPSGIYVYQLTTNDFSMSKRMVVEK